MIQSTVLKRSNSQVSVKKILSNKMCTKCVQQYHVIKLMN